MYMLCGMGDGVELRVLISFLCSSGAWVQNSHGRGALDTQLR